MTPAVGSTPTTSIEDTPELMPLFLPASREQRQPCPPTGRCSTAVNFVAPVARPGGTKSKETQR